MSDNQKRRVSFSVPDISELEVQYVGEALRSGWITTGPRTKELERRIADWIGVRRCVCLNSQTACAETALRLLGVGPGDEIITHAYTYTASASVIDHVGAKIVLIDCQPDSLELDYDALEAAINERTKVVIPVDLAGIPCDYERLYQVLERKKALFRPANALQEAIGRVAVVADAAHAFGSTLGGKLVGNFGDFTNFSFHAVKNFTVAEGGAMVYRDFDGFDADELYSRAQLLSLHGQSKDALAKEKLGGWEYDIKGLYYKCNMTDIMAAIGLAQFERYPAMLARRREIVERYDAAFKPLGIQTLPHYTERHCSNGHLYITRVPGISEERRNEIIVEMARRGISCNVHYKPLPLFSAYRELGFDIKDFPNAYAFYVNEITLPLHTCLTDEDVAYVIEAFTEIVKDALAG